MVTSKQILSVLVLALSILVSAPALAMVEAHVDINPVAVDQSFTLSLQSNSDGDPNLKPLQQDFEILGQSKSSSFSIINGSASRRVSWQIMLMPKHAGQVQIPALSVNNEASEPIAMTITAAGTGPVPGTNSDADKNQGSAAHHVGNLFVDVSAEPHSAYVQQQIVLTVRLYRAVDLGNGSSLSEPKFQNGEAAIEKLGQDREFQTTRNGQNFVVIERRYAIYPQKSGQLTIDPLQFDGTIVEDSGGGGIFSFDPFGARGRHVRVRSEPVTISVKPSPAHFSGAQWLPASRLDLAETWSQSPPAFTVGEPITRTLTITAQGVNASQLPALGTEASDGFKLYPDQAVLKNQPNGNGEAGIREQKIAMIPTRPGPHELPAIDIKWWNTVTDKEEIAHLPARRITVLPGTNVQSQIANPAAPTAEMQSPAAMESTPITGNRATPAAAWWPWLSLMLGLGWLITAIAWWRSRSRKPRVAAVPAQDEGLKKIERRLQKYCEENDARNATKQLLEWAKLRSPDNPPASLTAMARLCDPILADALKDLDRALYANAQTNWNGHAFWKLFVAHRPMNATEKQSDESGLEPLYRNM
jgi:hypothetical protein